MTLAIHTLLAQPIDLTGPYTGTVYDNTSPAGRAFTVNAGGGAAVYRAMLCPSVQSGTEEAPYELHTALQTALNAGTAGANWWTVTPLYGGIAPTAISYSGGATSGRIVWGTGATTAQPIKNILGFTADVGPLAHLGVQQATYMPTHTMWTVARANDAEWVPSAHGVAAARTGLGVVYAFSASVEQLTRKFDSTWHPRDASVAVAGEYTSPMRPTDKARWRRVSALPAPGLVPPWSVHEFLATARGRRLGALLGTLAGWRSGSVTSWDSVFLDLPTWDASNQVRPSIPLVDRYYDRLNIVLTFAGTES